MARRSSLQGSSAFDRVWTGYRLGPDARAMCRACSCMAGILSGPVSALARDMTR